MEANKYLIEYRCESKTVVSFDWTLFSSYEFEEDRDFAFSRVRTNGPSFFRFFEFRKVNK